MLRAPGSASPRRRLRASFVNVQCGVAGDIQLWADKSAAPKLSAQESHHSGVGDYDDIPSFRFEKVGDSSHAGTKIIPARALRFVSGHPAKAQCPVPDENRQT